MKVTLQEYNEDKVAAGLSPIKSVLGTRKLTMGTKPLAGAIGGTSGKINPLANGMIPSGATNKGGSMLKMAMSGEGYDKEALMGSIVGGLGKIFRSTSMINAGTRMNKKMLANHATSAEWKNKLMQASGGKTIWNPITRMRLSQIKRGASDPGVIQGLEANLASRVRASDRARSLRVAKAQFNRSNVAPQHATTIPTINQGPKTIEELKRLREEKYQTKKPITREQGEKSKQDWVKKYRKERINKNKPPSDPNADIKNPKKNTTLDGAHVELGSPEALKQQNAYLKNKIKSNKESGKGGGDTGGGSKIEKGLLEKSTDFVRKNPITSIAGAGVIGHMANNNSGSPVVVNN